jgi:ribosomal protein S18 acetylase RimI-like enzyme
MYKYLEDKNKNFDPSIKKHLMAYNEKFTGKQTYKEKYIYSLDENQELLGALTIYYFWDWASIGQVFYKNLDALKDMIYRSKDLLDDLVGLKLFTPVSSKFHDFIQAGFVDNGQIHMTKSLTYYHAYYKGLDHKLIYNVLTEDKPVEKYQSILDERTKDFNHKYGITGPKSHYDLVCLDNDKFIGGVQCLAYKETFYIDRLVVDEKYRKLSIGKTLMIKAEEHAKKLGYGIVELGTCDFQAKDFYKKLGYINVHERKNHPRNFTSYTLVKHI